MYYSNQYTVRIDNFFTNTTFPFIKTSNENINTPSSH